MPRKKLSLSKLQFILREESCKAKALGEMLMWIERREPALDESDVWLGYGLLIRKVGEKLDRWSKRVDEESLRRASSKRDKKKGAKP